jgi:hypothetical protein
MIILGLNNAAEKMDGYNKKKERLGSLSFNFFIVIPN